MQWVYFNSNACRHRELPESIDVDVELIVPSQTNRKGAFLQLATKWRIRKIDIYILETYRPARGPALKYLFWCFELTCPMRRAVHLGGIGSVKLYIAQTTRPDLARNTHGSRLPKHTIDMKIEYDNIN